MRKKRLILVPLMMCVCAMLLSVSVPVTFAESSLTSAGSSSGPLHGDFNGDNYDDLAIGVPGEDIGTIMDAGCVNVLYGSAGGLQATSPNDQLWHQNSYSVKGYCEHGDYFSAKWFVLIS